MAEHNIAVAIMSAHCVQLLTRLVQAITSTFSTRWKVVLVTLVAHLALVQQSF